MKTLFKFITFFLAATLSIPAAAQANVKFPPGLKWQMMPAVYFNFYQKKGTAAQKAAAQKIWASKISAKDPAFVLIDKVVTADSEYTFTMLDRPGGDCLPPGNGAGMNDMYSTCSMKVIQKVKATNKTSTRDIANYCFLHLDDGPGELAKNHTSMAYDEKSQTVFFRITQYGKHVAECNRQIKLK